MTLVEMVERPEAGEERMILIHLGMEEKLVALLELEEMLEAEEGRPGDQHLQWETSFGSFVVGMTFLWLLDASVSVTVVGYFGHSDLLTLLTAHFQSFLVDFHHHQWLLLLSFEKLIETVAWDVPYFPLLTCEISLEGKERFSAIKAKPQLCLLDSKQSKNLEG